MAGSTNYPNLKAGGPGYREGRVQKAIRRLLIAVDEKSVTTTEMMRMVWLRDEPWTESRWRHTRRAAERRETLAPTPLEAQNGYLVRPQTNEIRNLGAQVEITHNSTHERNW
jgi:hypothetical protein